MVLPVRLSVTVNGDHVPTKESDGKSFTEISLITGYGME